MMRCWRACCASFRRNSAAAPPRWPTGSARGSSRWPRAVTNAFERAPPMQLDVTHETRYDYSAPVSLAHHLAHLRPLSDPHQQLLSFGLEIDPPPGHMRDGSDALGNAESHFSLAVPHRKLRVRAISRVRLAPRFGDLEPESSPAWDAVAARLPYVAPGPSGGGPGLIP